ncbi:putative ribonuclease H-like domain-containing protein [Tanacetum coccineum]
MTHPSPKRNMVPKAVLMRSSLLSLNTARPVNTAQPKTIVNSARPMTNVFNKAHSTVRRPINNKTATKNSNFNKRVNTVSGKNVNTARPKAGVNTARLKVVLNAVKGNQVNAVKASACWVWKPKTKGNPQMDLQDQGVFDSGCLRHMTGNMSYLTDFEEIDEGYDMAWTQLEKVVKGLTIYGGDKLNLVAKGGDGGAWVAARGKLWVVIPLEVTPKEEKSQAELTDESHVLLKVPRKNNMYSVDLKNIVPKGGLTCLFAKATSDESKLWHRRLGHINFKTMNKLVKGNLVRGLPSKLFKNDQTCVACQKGKQHRAFCKSKTVSSISQPLHMLHMDLFGPTFVKSLMKKMYCLVVTDDYSRFSWVFFLATKDETNGILKSFITGVEYLIDQRVKKEDDNVNSTNNVNTSSDGNNTNNVNDVSSTVNAVSIEVNVVGAKTRIELPDDPNMPELEDIVYLDDYEDVGAEADMNNLNTFIPVIPIPTTSIHKNHSVEQIIGDLNSAPQTRRMANNLEERGLFSSVQQRTNHKDFQKCLFAWFLSQKEPKKVIHALKDPSWIEAMQEELLQLKLQEVWTLVDLPNGKRPIGTKWVYRNKKEKEAFVIKNKQGLVASRMLSYGKMKREVYVCQPPGFEDPNFPDRRGKIDKTLFIRRNKGLQVKQKKDGIFISQDKYVTEILKKFSFTDVKTAAHYGNSKPLPLKDEDGARSRTVVANSTTEAEYVADSSCCSQPSMKLKELMDFCTKLQQRVLDLENTKTAQAQEITSLKKRVKKLEKKRGSRTHKLKRLYMVGRSARVVSSEEASLGDQEDASKQGRKIDDINADEDITLKNVHDADMFRVNDLDGDEVIVKSEGTDKAGEKRNVVEEAVVVTDAVTIPVSAATITNVELTLAQTLAELKSASPKTKGVVMQEPSESTLTISLQLPSQVKGQGSKDKGKAKMIEPENPLKKKDPIKFDEEEALRQQAKFDEEDRLAREKAQ